MELSINYIAVVLGAVASMLVGFLWYSKALFGQPWMREMGYTEATLKKAQKEMGKLYGISFLFSLITIFVLAHVAELANNFYFWGKLDTALTSAFFLWLGFVMPVQFTGEMFTGKKWKFFAINTGYQLTSLLVAAVIIGVM